MGKCHSECQGEGGPTSGKDAAGSGGAPAVRDIIQIQICQ